jgi:hypothetical protein
MGSSTSKTLKPTNAQNKVLNFLIFGADELFGYWLRSDRASVYELHLDGDVPTRRRGHVQTKPYG